MHAASASSIRFHLIWSFRCPHFIKKLYIIIAMHHIKFFSFHVKLFKQEVAKIRNLFSCFGQIFRLRKEELYLIYRLLTNI